MASVLGRAATGDSAFGSAADLHLQRLRLDGRDRWVAVSIGEARAEIEARFGPWDAACALLAAGHEIRTPYAYYRRVIQS